MSYPYYNKHRAPLTPDQLTERYIILEPWVQFYHYILSAEEIVTNIKKFSNKDLEDIRFDLQYLGGTFENKPELKKKYADIDYQYQKHYANLLEQQQLAQQQLAQYAQQAQQGYTPVNYTGNQQYYNQNQNYQDPNYQQQAYQQQAYQQQAYQQQAYQQGQPYQQQQQYSQGSSYQQQGQGGYRNDRRNNQNYNQNREGRGGYNQGEGYNQQQYQNQQYQSNQHEQYQQQPNQYQNQRGDREHYKKNTYHEKGHYQHHQHHQAPVLPHKNFLEDQFESQQTKIQEKPVVVTPPVPKVQTPPPPPPKPAPKPTKFTIIQIKDFINSFSKEELEKHATPEVVAKAKQISQWKCEQVDVELKEQPNRMQRKESKRPQDGNKNNNSIKTGLIKRDQAKQAERLGYRGNEDKKVLIVVGAKQTLQTKQMKEELKKRAFDFVGQKLQEEKGLDKVDLDRKQIVYNLNKIVPENLKDIEKDLFVYLYKDQITCKILIEQVIKKAWDQPKYAGTYAKLCSDFSKRPHNEFHFQCVKKQKDNPFKFYLIETVQHSFDQKIEKFPVFENAQEKQIFLKDTKKKILSNVKFIAELIINKILKKRTIKYCISQLFESFLKHYYSYIHDKQIEDSVYDYHYEAIIEFIQNIGEKYETLDEKQKQKQAKPLYSYSQIKDHIDSVLKVACPPNNQILDQLGDLTGDQYFKILDFIDSTYMKKNFTRLSALFQNLVERRNNKWQKHLSLAEGPKKLNQLSHEDDQNQGVHAKLSKQKAQQQKVDKKVKDLYDGWQAGKKEEQRQFKDLVKKHRVQDVYLSLLKQVADEKKENVVKRVALFEVLFDYEQFNYKQFRNAWVNAIKYLSFGGEDFPFCGAALAKVLNIAISKGEKLQDFNYKYEEEDDYFNKEVLQKYHHYSQNEEALKYIKPKAKYSGLI